MIVRYLKTVEVDIPAGTSVMMTNGIGGTVVAAVGEAAPGWYWIDYLDDDLGPQRGQFELSALPPELFPGEAENMQAQRVGIAEPPA